MVVERERSFEQRKRASQKQNHFRQRQCKEHLTSIICSPFTINQPSIVSRAGMNSTATRLVEGALWFDTLSHFAREENLGDIVSEALVRTCVGETDVSTKNASIPKECRQVR